MLISKKMEKALNDQLVLEAMANFSYLAMASWCEKKGLEGGAKFFYKHAAEENDHMMKIFLYINEVGGHAITPAVRQPQLEFKSILEICQNALANEKKVTKSIHKIVSLALSEDDHVTHEFLNFFVREQREEEVLFDRVIDKINLIGKGGQSAFFIDTMLSDLTDEEISMEAEA